MTTISACSDICSDALAGYRFFFFLVADFLLDVLVVALRFAAIWSPPVMKCDEQFGLSRDLTPLPGDLSKRAALPLNPTFAVGRNIPAKHSRFNES